MIACAHALTSSLASAMVLRSSSDITNKNVKINAGSMLNCSVIAFFSEVRKSDRCRCGQVLALNFYTFDEYIHI